jgi:hypothetical protein
LFVNQVDRKIILKIENLRTDHDLEDVINIEEHDPEGSEGKDRSHDK